MQWSLGYRTPHMRKSLIVRNLAWSTKTVPSFLSKNQPLVSTLVSTLVSEHYRIHQNLEHVFFITIWMLFETLDERGATHKLKSSNFQIDRTSNLHVSSTRVAAVSVAWPAQRTAGWVATDNHKPFLRVTLQWSWVKMGDFCLEIPYRYRDRSTVTFL